MKTIKDLKNYVKSTSRLVMKDIVDMNSLYNAFTEVYKGNLVALPSRSDALHSVLDSVVDFKMDETLFDEAELVPVEVAEVATSENIVGNINGEVPADIYEEDPF